MLPISIGVNSLKLEVQSAAEIPVRRDENPAPISRRQRDVTLLQQIAHVRHHFHAARENSRQRLANLHAQERIEVIKALAESVLARNHRSAGPFLAGGELCV